MAATLSSSLSHDFFIELAGKYNVYLVPMHFIFAENWLFH